MTTPDFEVDLDSADSILEITGWCLRADERLNEEKPWDGFVILTGFEEAHAAMQAWRFVGAETLPTAVNIANPAFNLDVMEQLRELTADPKRGKWQTWVILYDLASDSFDHIFLWPGEDAGYNVIGYDTPMSTIEALNPAHPAEEPQWLTSARGKPSV
ncbi:hypothetical protein JOE56_000356 [Brevibacterium paucivorans]|uniref:Uncharacterized protein n=1 Tax=Brevibacterium paucivorans TaxID=170994 RepID=A0ABS2SHE6_9MICO|nr:hypothetical protein [Brevibacterium paucivorans]MBM7815662.1 hypothetical protein [Brevibacterium paucivorans]